jgi:hypothetical protein
MICSFFQDVNRLGRDTLAASLCCSVVYCEVDHWTGLLVGCWGFGIGLILTVDHLGCFADRIFLMRYSTLWMFFLVLREWDWWMTGGEEPNGLGLFVSGFLFP